MTIYAMRTEARSELDGCPHSGWVHSSTDGFPVLVSDDADLLDYWLPRSLGRIAEYTGEEPTIDIYDAWLCLSDEDKWDDDTAT